MGFCAIGCAGAGSGSFQHTIPPSPCLTGTPAIADARMPATVTALLSPSAALANIKQAWEDCAPAVILYVGLLGWVFLVLFKNEMALRRLNTCIKELAQQRSEVDSDENPHSSSVQVPVAPAAATLPRQSLPPVHAVSRVNSAVEAPQKSSSSKSSPSSVRKSSPCPSSVVRTNSAAVSPLTPMSSLLWGSPQRLPSSPIMAGGTHERGRTLSTANTNQPLSTGATGGGLHRASSRRVSLTNQPLTQAPDATGKGQPLTPGASGGGQPLSTGATGGGLQRAMSLSPPQKKSNASVLSKPIRGLNRKSSPSGGSRFAAAALGRQYANNPPLQLSKIPSF